MLYLVRRITVVYYPRLLDFVRITWNDIMVLIVCVDDNNGLMFNKRRLSSDRAVLLDILELLGADSIAMTHYSASLFQGFESKIVTSEDFLDLKCNFVFAECGDFLKIAHDVDMLILYKWNRKYPSDQKFPLDVFTSAMTLKSTNDFVGNSHPCVTREVYVR